MPEKDGDEGKSTKSVVNKRQKQMMGEEGYDIARDMGRVRPSKDKKDATTMPPSKEMKKTQKVVKGPSAFERVKAKYGKSVMKVEELDLTQVAEAFGGYIVEANGKKKEPKTPSQPEVGFGGKAGEQPFTDRQRAEVGTILKNIGKDPKGTAEKVKKEAETIKPTEKEIRKQKRQVSRAEMQKTSPKPGEAQKEREIVKKFMDARKKTPDVEKELPRPAEPSFLDPKTNPFDTVPDAPKITGRKDAANRARAAQERRAVKGYDDILKAIQTGTTKTGADAEKVARGRGRTARRYTLSPEKRAERLAKVKSEIDRKNPTFTSPVTGGQLPVGGADDYQKRLSKAYDKSLEGTVKTGQVPAGRPLPPINPKPPEEPKPQKDREQQQQQRSYKDFIDQTEFINKKTGERFDMNDPEQKNEYLRQQGKKYRTSKQKEDPRGGGSGGSGGGKGGSGGGKGGSGGGGLSNTGGPLVPKGGDLDKPKEPKGSVVSNSLEKVKNFAKRNPVAALAAYDLGKGVLGKILKVKSFAPGVVGGTVGRRSARGGGGL